MIMILHVFGFIADYHVKESRLDVRAKKTCSQELPQA